MEFNTGGFEELLFTLIEGIVNLNLKEMDLDYLGQVLTLFAPILNPIWAVLGEMASWIGLT